MTVHPKLLIPDTGPGDEMDSEASFRCRAACRLVYKTKATRNKCAFLCMLHDDNN